MKTFARSAAMSAAACAALILAGCTSTATGEASIAGSETAGGSSSSASATTSATTSAEAPATADVDVFDLTVGDCMVEDLGMGDSVEGDQLTVDCADPHQAEAYAAKDVEGSTFPGEAEVSDAADEFCAEAFGSFVGMDYNDSELEISMLMPTARSWRGGDREILCLVVDPAGDTTGTLRGANR